MDYILSKESYDADNEIGFRLVQSSPHIYRYGKYYSDGEMVIDTDKNYYHSDKVQDLTEQQFETTIKPLVRDEYLQNNVLKEENYVEFSDIAYKNVCLLKGKNNHLINSFYYNELRNLELFWYDEKIFFFEYLEAEESAGIDFDSYMFIGVVMGIKENSNFSKKTLETLEKLDNCLKGE